MGVLSSGIRIKRWHSVKGSAHLQDTDQVAKFGVLTSRILIKWFTCRKGVLSSKIRIKWRNYRNGSARLQDPDQVVKLRKECLPPGSGSSGETEKGVLTSRIRIKWWNWERSAYLQDPD
jgi:hypothetical protein